MAKQVGEQVEMPPHGLLVLSFVFFFSTALCPQRWGISQGPGPKPASWVGASPQTQLSQLVSILGATRAP